jgi:hypothetical protein
MTEDMLPVLLVVLALPLPARAADAVARESPPSAQSDSPYTGQGPFVNYPARFVSTPIFGMGYMVGVLVCAPISLMQDPHLEGKVPEEKQAHLRCGRAVGTAIRWPVYAVVGLPFYLAKKLFWDIPRKIDSVAGPPVAKVSRPVVKAVEDWWAEGDDAPPPRPADSKPESAAPWLNP